LITLGAVALAFAAGSALGVVAGYYGGLSSTVIMRAMDVLLAIPGFLLAVAVIAALGVGMGNVIIAIGVNSIPPFARIARGSTLLARQEVYVQAAQALGAGERTIMLRHIVPNILSPLVVQSTLRLATAILTASGLSFLGLGVQPPTASWGLMVSTGRNYLLEAPHIATFAGLAIAFAVLGFNLFADGLQDALDTKATP
jgi:peptide/nickel transport system permease protein